MPTTISGSTGLGLTGSGNQVSFPDSSVQTTAATGFGFKNRLINGAMVIDQRNGGASVTPINSQNTLDRWQMWVSQTSKLTVQQNAGSITPPVGFTKYLGVTSLSAYSVISTDYFGVWQGIEGFNISDLAWGTANAKTVTVSFQVYSSLTGTFGGAIQNAAGNRGYTFSYSIPVANTWTSISITITGDTTGTWTTDNTRGLQVFFALGMGSTLIGAPNSWGSTVYLAPTGQTSIVGTSGATWYITGVQLEVGSTATSFDYRPYGTEFMLCQRYYQSIAYPRVFMNLSGSNAFFTPVYFVASMRAAPTVTLPSSAGNVVLNSSEVAVVPSFQWNASNITTNSFSLRGGTSNIGGIVEGTATASSEF